MTTIDETGSKALKRPGEFEVGTRIIAVGSMTDRGAQLLGGGVYSGDEITTLPFATPKLTLDNGDVVYGHECWWGPEDRMQERLDIIRSNGGVIYNISVADLRRCGAAILA